MNITIGCICSDLHQTLIEKISIIINRQGLLSVRNHYIYTLLYLVKIIKNMTEQKFDEINDHFNSLMGENGLLDVMTVIDGESIISRVYKKCNGKIDTNVLAVIMLYNKHIVDEQYEAADKLKSHILNFY